MNDIVKKKRQYLLLFLISAAFLLIAARLLNIQVLDSDSLRQKAKKQYASVLRLPPNRGIIYDETKSILALNIDTPSVFASPNIIIDKKESAKRLSSILGLSYPEVHEKLLKDKSFAWIKRGITEKEKNLLEKEKIEGVFLTDEPKRLSLIHI